MIPTPSYLFDLDGTIIDSEPWHKLAEIEAFSHFGIELDETVLNPYMGNTLPILVEGINDQFGRNITVEEFLEIERPILQNYIEQRMHMFVDAQNLISRLAEFNKAIVTSSMEWYLESVLRRFPVLKSEFDVHICQSNVTEGKPNAEPYQLAAKLLKIDPQNCIVFEDSVNGVASGKSAGCWVVGVDRESIGHLGAADQVVSSLDEPYLANVRISN